MVWKGFRKNSVSLEVEELHICVFFTYFVLCFLLLLSSSFPLLSLHHSALSSLMFESVSVLSFSHPIPSPLLYFPFTSPFPDSFSFPHFPFFLFLILHYFSHLSSPTFSLFSYPTPVPPLFFPFHSFPSSLSVFTFAQLCLSFSFLTPLPLSPQCPSG